LKPIRGKANIVRFFEGALRHRAEKRGDAGEYEHIERAQINGLPGFVIHMHHGPETIAFEIADGRIVAIYAIRNPDKLRHLSGQEVVEASTTQPSREGVAGKAATRVDVHVEDAGVNRRIPTHHLARLFDTEPKDGDASYGIGADGTHDRQHAVRS